MRAGSCASSGTDQGHLPLVNCPHCGVRVVKIRSKKAESYGKIFFVCPNNIRDDPTTCGFIRSENQYAAYVNGLEARDQLKQEPTSFTGMEWHRLDELKQQLDELKIQMERAMVEIWNLKMQAAQAKAAIPVVTLCLGLVTGIVVTMMFK